jgi:putative hemolysin
VNLRNGAPPPEVRVSIDAPVPESPFHLHAPPLVPWLGGAISRLLGLARLSAVYERAAEGGDFVDEALCALGVAYATSDEERARIPRTGPLVVVANHPFGAVEGLVLLDLVRRVRADVRVLANRLLARIPEMRPLIFDVDVFGGSGAAASNRAALRSAIRWVRAGGVLAVFPAGEVAHARPFRGAVDPPWSEDVATLARRCGAAVLPVWFDGTNGPLFHAAGLVHPRLRTALLPRELLNKTGRTLALRVGAVIGADRLKRFGDDTSATAFLRARTEVLGSVRAPAVAAAPADAVCREPIADAEDPQILAEAIAALAPDRVLAESGGLAVVLVVGEEAPVLLRAVGRAREVAFRDAGEGTGRAIDVDRFDPHYLHLVLWDRAARAVAGGYRLAPTDTVLREHGRDGLYTTTLFAPTAEFFERMGPALELGRSFVVPERQRSFAPLMLLWKAIGAYVARRPHYRTLFGPVSISARYPPFARHLMIEWLTRNASERTLEPLVSPRRPVRARGAQARRARSTCSALPLFEDLSDAVCDVEPRLRGVPTLVREYHRLSGRFAAFNVDPDFSDVVDGLVVVDLLATDRRTLARYLGRDGLGTFLAYHGATAAERAVPAAG